MSRPFSTKGFFDESTAWLCADPRLGGLSHVQDNTRKEERRAKQLLRFSRFIQLSLSARILAWSLVSSIQAIHCLFLNSFTVKKL